MFLFSGKLRPVVGCVERTPGIGKAVVHSLYERFIAIFNLVSSPVVGRPLLRTC
jgi:hypothetical protein